MKITRKEVVHVARLGRLEMDENEMEKYTDQLNAILEYADRLNKLDTSDVEPTSHVLLMKNVFRQDQVEPPLSREEVLAGAPEKEDGMFLVPRVIE